jgi:chemotaxis protein methyltransferase CheR
MKEKKTSALTREFVFTDAEFTHISQLVYDYAGINLPLSKKDMVYSRLAKRLRANKLDTFSDYLGLIDSSKAPEWEFFINAITTNVTSFFREEHHFKALADYIKTIPQHYPVNIWCNAASTGEEPYSIAMAMMDAFDTLKPPVRIIATDIDTFALQTAREGVYSAEQVDKLPIGFLYRFFFKGVNEQAGYVKVRPELSNLIEFKALNLQESHWSVDGPFSAIFCRNVMIYFDKPTQYKILKRFIPLMYNDALLFAGHSESLQNLPELFKLSGRTIYNIAEVAQANARHFKQK